MFNLLLFDLDGTLTDPKEGITNCVKYALESYGIKETDESVLLRFIGPPLYDSFRKYYNFSHDDANKAVEKYRERFSTIGLFENTIFDDTVKTLTELKKAGKTLALATSKPYVFTKRILDKFDIAKYFDIAVGSELDGTRAYKFEIIEEVLKRSKITDISRAIMIGDRKDDISGAKKNSIASIGIRCGYAENNELEEAGADYIFDNLTEIKNFLLKTS